MEGCISRFDKELSKAQKDYNEECTRIARNQKEAHAKLLELAPKMLQRHLQIAIHQLLAHKMASFKLYAAGKERCAKKAAVLAELGRAWKGVVEVDACLYLKRPERARYTVYLRAVPFEK